MKQIVLLGLVLTAIDASALEKVKVYEITETMGRSNSGAWLHPNGDVIGRRSTRQYIQTPRNLGRVSEIQFRSYSEVGRCKLQVGDVRYAERVGGSAIRPDDYLGSGAFGIDDQEVAEIGFKWRHIGEQGAECTLAVFVVSENQPDGGGSGFDDPAFNEGELGLLRIRTISLATRAMILGDSYDSVADASDSFSELLQDIANALEEDRLDRRPSAVYRAYVADLRRAFHDVQHEFRSRYFDNPDAEIRSIYNRWSDSYSKFVEQD